MVVASPPRSLKPTLSSAGATDTARLFPKLPKLDDKAGRPGDRSRRRVRGGPRHS